MTTARNACLDPSAIEILDTSEDDRSVIDRIDVCAEELRGELQDRPSQLEIIVRGDCLIGENIRTCLAKP